MTRRNGTGWYIYVLCFVLPFFGLAYGAMERCRDDEGGTRRGKICIMLGILSTVLICGGSLVWLITNIKADLGLLLPG